MNPPDTPMLGGVFNFRAACVGSIEFKRARFGLATNYSTSLQVRIDFASQREFSLVMPSGTDVERPFTPDVPFPALDSSNIVNQPPDVQVLDLVGNVGFLERWAIRANRFRVVGDRDVRRGNNNEGNEKLLRKTINDVARHIGSVRTAYEKVQSSIISVNFEDGIRQGLLSEWADITEVCVVNTFLFFLISLL